MSRFASKLPKALAVLFAALVVGGSLLVILHDQEARKQLARRGSQTGVERPAPPNVERELPSADNADSAESVRAPDPVPRNSHAAQNSVSDRFVSRSAGTAIPPGIKTIRTVPHTDAELAVAFDQAENDACELLPAGEPLEITSFTPYLTQRDRRSSHPVPSLRRSAFAIGLELAAEEKQRLPLISRTPIVAYLQNHYVSVQARVRRDPRTGVRYLHHRPLAAAATFAGARLTEKPEAAVASSVHDFRSLGLLAAGDGPSAVADLRTLVLVHKHAVAGSSAATGSAEFRPNYELAFIHASASDGDGTEPLTLDAFVTSGSRLRLHHLRSRAPSRPGTCGIRADVRLNEFTYGGTYPTEAIVREISLSDKASFSWKQLDAFAESQGWSGGAWNRLPEIFRAILDGTLSRAS